MDLLHFCTSEQRPLHYNQQADGSWMSLFWQCLPPGILMRSSSQGHAHTMVTFVFITFFKLLWFPLAHTQLTFEIVFLSRTDWGSHGLWVVLTRAGRVGAEKDWGANLEILLSFINFWDIMLPWFFFCFSAFSRAAFYPDLTCMKSPPLVLLLFLFSFSLVKAFQPLSFSLELW